MKSIIKIDEALLKYIFYTESKKLVGICMKRFEIHPNPEDQKKAIKEVIYENLRSMCESIVVNGKDSIRLENGGNKK